MLLDLDRLAKTNKLTLWGLTPAQPLPTVDMLQQPYTVVLEGRFASVSKFLREVRKLVGIQRGRLAVKGRVYTVDQVTLEQPAGGDTFPVVRATVTVNAYSFAADDAGSRRRRDPDNDDPDRDGRGRSDSLMAKTNNIVAQKQRQQKIILIVLGVVLLGVAALQGPKLLGGSDEPAPAAAPAGSTSAGTTVVPGGAATTAGSATQTSVLPAGVPRAVLVGVPVGGGALLKPGEGQLVPSLSSRAKDPFVQTLPRSPPQRTPAAPGRLRSARAAGRRRRHGRRRLDRTATRHRPRSPRSQSTATRSRSR